MTLVLDQALILAGVLFCCCVALWMVGRKWFVRWQLGRRWAHAAKAEAQAPKILQTLGYEVLGAQVQGGYTLMVDARPVAVSLRADYLVRRDGRLYIAEVKSGRVAPRLDTAATRRQLLEYRMAFAVDGVLLVNAELGSVQQVVFPVVTGRTSRPGLNLGLSKWGK